MTTTRASISALLAAPLLVLLGCTPPPATPIIIIAAVPSAPPPEPPPAPEPHAGTPPPPEPPPPESSSPPPLEGPPAPATPLPTAQSPTPPARSAGATLNGTDLELPSPVLFETGTDKLKPESDAVLQGVKSFLDARSDVTMLRIEGHTDSMGASAMNQRLSEARALAIARWLVYHGVDCTRLLPVGFGDARPIADDSTAAGRAQNRRMRLVIAALRLRPVGGMPVDGGGKVAGDPCH